MEGTGESTLRAKYLDWCSARLAERFLDLSPEEIYALARPEEPSQTQRRGENVAGESAAEESGAAEPVLSGVPDSPSHPEAPDSPPSPSLPRPTDEGYRTLVQRVTEALLRRTSLPTFEQWAEAYAETPERFEAELLGFWKDAVADEGADAGDEAAG